MRQVVQPVKYPECTDHDRRTTDAHKCEEQANCKERNAVDHLFDAHCPVTGLQSKECVQARQSEQTQGVQPTLPTNESCQDYGEHTYRTTTESFNHDSPSLDA